MAITNYSELKSAIADWLDRTDLTDQIPDFITLAEARHKRDFSWGFFSDHQKINLTTISLGKSVSGSIFRKICFLGPLFGKTVFVGRFLKTVLFNGPKFQGKSNPKA